MGILGIISVLTLTATEFVSFGKPYSINTIPGSGFPDDNFTKIGEFYTGKLTNGVVST
jgi:hypothetical protein